MKNIFLSFALLLFSSLAFAQSTVEVDEVSLPATAPGIERVFVEKWTGGNVPAGYTAYRVFVDMPAGHKLVNIFGNSVSTLSIEPTNGQFYNSSFGVSFGDILNAGLFGIDAATEFDSYLTVGGSASNRIAVPYAVNNAGFIAGTPGATSTSPGLVVSMFGTTSTTTSFVTAGGLWNIPGGISYENLVADNTILIGQFTTSADLTMTFSIDLNRVTNTSLLSTYGIFYTSEVIPHVNPQVGALTPATGSALAYGVATTVSSLVTVDQAQADGLGAVASAVFNVNGTDHNATVSGSVYSYDVTPASLDPINVTFTLKDAANVTATASASYTVNDPNPTTVTLAALAAQISGDDLPITLSATATDADGIASVEFFLADGTLIGAGVASGSTYTYDWSPAFGTYQVYAVATPAAGIPVAVESNRVSTTVYNPSSFYSLGGDVTEACYVNNKFCVPFTRVNSDMAAINGFDVVMQFEADKVAPTGIITVNSALIDRDVTDYTYRVDGDSMFISVYLKGNAPATALWNGQGEIFCVEFAKTNNFASNDAVVFGTNSIVESYVDGYVDQIAGAESATYTTFVDDIFVGKLIFWGNGAPISGNVAGGYALTLFGNITAANMVEPNVNGIVEYDFLDATGAVINSGNVQIEKDLPNNTPSDSVMIAINGYDAYLTTKVLTKDPSFTPTVFQIIAMDVNLDGRVTAGDISQMNQRAVRIRDEFTQASGAGIDWVFVSNEDLQNIARFRISPSYPEGDATYVNRYWRDNVPAASESYQIPGAGADCPNPAMETFQLILLGDVDGSYANKAVDGSMKSTSIGINFGAAYVKGDVVSIPVNVKDAVSASFVLDFDGEFVSVSNAAGVTSTANVVDGKLALVSNSAAEISGTFVTLNFKGNPNLTPSTTLVNGRLVAASIASEKFGINVSEVAAYPVPAEDILTVATPEDATLAIVDINGVVVKTAELFAGENLVNVQDLAAGSYILKVNGVNIASVKHIIIK